MSSSKNDLYLLEFLHKITILITIGYGFGWIPIFIIFLMVFFVLPTFPFVLLINCLLIFILELSIVVSYYLYFQKKSKTFKPEGTAIIITIGLIGLLGSFIPIGIFDEALVHLTSLSGIHALPSFWFFWTWLFPIIGGILNWYLFRIKMKEKNE